jgi:hypothetical protein
MKWYWKVLIVLSVLGSCHSYNETPSNREKDIEVLKTYLQAHKQAIDWDRGALEIYMQRSDAEAYQTYLRSHASALWRESSALGTYLQQLEAIR